MPPRMRPREGDFRVQVLSRPTGEDGRREASLDIKTTPDVRVRKDDRMCAVTAERFQNHSTRRNCLGQYSFRYSELRG